jgi:CRISPR-associated endonuclease/helicase Cas3
VPARLDLPTGAGKTAALDVAVFHLALEAAKGEARRAPVRIAFVVDRRLIVDDAYIRARRIESALRKAACDLSAPDVLRQVAAALGRLAERAERPLVVRRLRGGVPREDDWARTPHQPTILCSTVDQVGSRLLFRGYGVSDSMKPVHAGLLGSDCLILLDEAHLSEPFRQTLMSIIRHRGDWRDSGCTPRAPFGVALLTATPGRVSDETFELEQADREHPVLRSRLTAAKSAELASTGRSIDEAEKRRIRALVEGVASAFAHFEREKLETRPVVAVVVNRVLRARNLFRQLQEIYGPVDEGMPPRAEVLLVIGPAREIDGERLSTRLDPIKTGRNAERRELARPCIVVATQTIEAGVDLDFDALITEIAALDALKQRFGRLNRAGRKFVPYAAIIADREDERPDKDGGDPVYGNAAADTWRVLRELAKDRGDEERVDFGALPSAGIPWVGGIPAKQVGSLLAPKEDAPVLMPAYLDLWSQTSPVPDADPEVSLFLHGPDRAAAGVQIVWRGDFEFGRRGFDPAALLAAMPPKSGEVVEVSLSAARRWLRAAATERAATEADFADSPQREPAAETGTGGRPAFRWAGPESPRTRQVFARDLWPGDLIVVPAEYGGCDEFGWDPQSEIPVKDVADRAAEPFSIRRYALRLTPKLFAASASSAPPGDFVAALNDVMAELGEGRLKRDAAALIAALQASVPPPGVALALDRLLRSRARARLQAIFPYGEEEEEHPRGVVLIAPKGRLGIAAEGEGGTPTTEDDWLGSGSGVPQTLDEHSCQVRDRAAVFAENAGFDPAIAGDIALAAYLHDAGKADPRFQAMLYGGDWLEVDDRRVLAKSGQRVATAWARSGLPEHWRHEALSVRIARGHALFREAHDPDLVLWLIGVHHGHGRPFFPHCDEAAPEHLPDVLGGMKATPGPGPQSLAFSFNGRDWPQLFERLKRRYGVWELARLEAIVRLADHRASETP